MIRFPNVRVLHGHHWLSWSKCENINPKVVGSIPAKTQKIEDSNLHGFELHRPSSKGTKVMFTVMKAIINQPDSID